MEIIGQMLESILAILNIEFTVWGFTLTLWKVFVFTAVSLIMSWVIWEVILGDE